MIDDDEIRSPFQAPGLTHEHSKKMVVRIHRCQMDTDDVATIAPSQGCNAKYAKNLELEIKRWSTTAAEPYELCSFLQ